MQKPPQTGRFCRWIEKIFVVQNAAYERFTIPDGSFLKLFPENPLVRFFKRVSKEQELEEHHAKSSNQNG
jgi:hypothetical protein